MISSSLLADLTVGALPLGFGLLFAARSSAPFNRVMIVTCVFHPLASTALFYSLAFHMHRSLDGWPRTLGNQGFPRALAVHADVAIFVFGALAAACVFIWPLAVVLCTCVRKLRPGLRFLGVYALTSAVAFGAMLLAPAPYLNWWWD